MLLRAPKGATDGVSLKTHLLQVYKTTKKKPQQLSDQGECPEELAYLWAWLLEMRLPLTYTELHHWQALTRRNLSAWEVDVLMKLDRMARA